MCQMDAHIIPPPGNQPSISLASEPRKKKRVHRAAKLKQCKLDARREQWLAQVSTKANQSGCKENNEVPLSKSVQGDATDACVSSAHRGKNDTGLLSHSSQDEIDITQSGMDKANKETKLSQQSSQGIIQDMGPVKDADMKNEDVLSRPSQASRNTAPPLSGPLQDFIDIDDENHKDGALLQSSQDSIHINDSEKNEDAGMSASLQHSILVDENGKENASISEVSGDSIHVPEKDMDAKHPDDARSQFSDNAILVALKEGDANMNREVPLPQPAQGIIHMAIMCDANDRNASMPDRQIPSSKNAVDGNISLHDVDRGAPHLTMVHVQDLSENHHLGFLHSHDFNGVESPSHLQQSADGSIESGVRINDGRTESNTAEFGGGSLVPSWSSSEASSSRSISSHGSSCSASDDEAEEDDNEDEVEDWEAVADALSIQECRREDNNPNGNLPENKQANERNPELWRSDMEKCVLRPHGRLRMESSGYRARADVSRAWRPDDMSRPLTLPCLKKQNSFPAQSLKHERDVWGIPLAPLHCPICTEELDATDSSFLPCPCGFRLCLFCHHKIIIGDARCPGCRKPYNLEEASKLSRSASLRPRLLN